MNNNFFPFSAQTSFAITMRSEKKKEATKKKESSGVTIKVSSECWFLIEFSSQYVSSFICSRLDVSIRNRQIKETFLFWLLLFCKWGYNEKHKQIQTRGDTFTAIQPFSNLWKAILCLVFFCGASVDWTVKNRAEQKAFIHFFHSDVWLLSSQAHFVVVVVVRCRFSLMSTWTREAFERNLWVIK